MRKRIYLMCVVFWMTVIFVFSSRDASQSTQDSSRIGYAIAKLTVPDFETWSPQQQTEYVEHIDFYVRKTAHALEYTVLGFLISGAIEIGSGKWMWLLAWALGAMYAATDEFHQYFVPGRSCELRDICIDSAGVLLGVLIGLAVTKLRMRKEKRPA